MQTLKRDGKDSNCNLQHDKTNIEKTNNTKVSEPSHEKYDAMVELSSRLVLRSRGRSSEDGLLSLGLYPWLMRYYQDLAKEVDQLSWLEAIVLLVYHFLVLYLLLA